MAISTPKSAYLRGVTGALPFLLVVIPFGMLFGVVGTEAGLNLAQVMGFTTLVIAGAAQFTAIQLMVDDAPTIVVIVSALAVNLRMAMYAAALAPYLGQAPLWQRAVIAYLNVDQTYALSNQQFEDRPEMTVRERIAFFFGCATPILPTWIVATLAGAVLGAAIPPEYALDFAVPITFIALVAPGLRTLAHVAAALTSVLLALSLAWIPHNLWILAAALGGMMVGAEIERRSAS
jgi:branched chain amino acid efflux pump